MNLLIWALPKDLLHHVEAQDIHVEETVHVTEVKAVEAARDQELPRQVPKKIKMENLANYTI